ncbi:MAG: beta-lactamase family protein [Bacteroidia bacterium]|nr:beta-lactamase family protein [Bacteroidia bacterium]
MKKRIGIFIATLALGTGLNVSAQINKVSERVKVVIDSTYNALIKKYKVVGLSLAIVDNGEIVYTNGYGFADRENKVAASDKTIYRIGSCTKSFTSLSILQLQEKKLLNINNSIKDYLPELKIESRFNDNNRIYINDMMAHVSGLPCDIINGFFCDSPPDINWVIEELNKQTTISPRRYKQAYSNIAYGLLGETIARLGKTTYSNYIKENIFKPLNMTSSYIDNDAELSKGFAKAYIDNKPLKEPLIRDQAAGLIHSNVLDMSNYLMMFLNKGSYNGKQILGQESIADMQQNHITDLYLPSSQDWGYGLYSKKVIVKKDKDSAFVRITGHGGDTYAYHADFGFINELGIGVVLLTNSDNGTIVNDAEKLLKIYLKNAKGKTLVTSYEEPLSDYAVANKGTNCALAERIGNYNFGNFAMQVKNVKKIKFKQGPATITMKPVKNDTNNYKIKIRIFGVVPISMNDEQWKFAKKDGTVYLKSTKTKSKKESFVGIRSSSLPITASWRNAFGKYKVVNKVYSCTDCPYTNNEGITLSISESKGFVQIKTKAKSPDMKNTALLELISDKLAVTGGIGRGTGETVRITENGNVYYNGFEFKKVK